MVDKPVAESAANSGVTHARHGASFTKSGGRQDHRQGDPPGWSQTLFFAGYTACRGAGFACGTPPLKRVGLYRRGSMIPRRSRLRSVHNSSPLAERTEQAPIAVGTREAALPDRARNAVLARTLVTKLLKYWSKVKGLTRIDGRTRRTQLAQQHAIPPLYQQIAERVMELYGENLLLVEIAQQLQCDRSTITDAIRWWHASRRTGGAGWSSTP